MSDDYSAPLDDMRFVLEHITNLDEIIHLGDFHELDLHTAFGLLDEAARFYEQVIAPTNQIGDVEGSTWEDGEVTTPEVYKEAYAKYVEAGWNTLNFPEEYGGGGVPNSLTIAQQEMLSSANLSFSMAPGLTQGAIDMLLNHADEEQKETWVPKMVHGEWTGTMNLTEPQAGSDVGALSTKAVKQDDGTYRITGTKIFISFGEHDLAENIVHLVLARTPDAPPGTKGISCFIVPKYLLNEDGSLGERNDVRCVSIEKKMGIKSSPTCVMSYGEEDGAVGYLIGEENRGMRYMFTMMNAARVHVGLSGLSVAERAYQDAVAYARERVQGRPIGADADDDTTIIAHVDVRRMLMEMKSKVEAMRIIVYTNMAAIDLAEHHPDESVRESYAQFAEVLTPITKSWCTDTGCEVASLGIQVHGGMGFIEETGVAQYYRDLRITPIYEGTNGIQAMDLVGRKLPLAGGTPVLSLIAQLREIDKDLAGFEGDEWTSIRDAVHDGVDAIEKATGWIFENGLKDPNDALAGSYPYLNLFGTVLGGYYLAKSAIAAAGLLDDGDVDEKTRTFLESKIRTARYYAEYILPQGTALLGPATSGKASIMAISAEDL